LTKQSHTKAAEALKKAAKDVVVIKDGIVPEGPTLEEIVKQWKAAQIKEAASSEYVLQLCLL
jgi:cell division protein YceG involved in septum cleavage